MNIKPPNASPTERFYRLVWPHRQAVLRVARLLLRNSTEAEDLAQETLLKAFKAIDGFRENTNVRAWLMSILRNTRTDRLRVARDVQSLEDLTFEPADPRAAPADGWEAPQDVLQGFSDPEIIDALKELPEEIRWTLLLADVEGLEHSEVAGILGVPVGTVKSRCHRGRAMLREALLPLARERRLIRDS